MSEFRRRLMMAHGDVGPTIPYHRVEYLQSSGTQGIDTGIIPDSSTMFQYRFMKLDYTEWGCLVGYLDPDNNDYRAFTYLHVAVFDIKNARLIGPSQSLMPNRVYNYEYGNCYIKNIDTDTILASGAAITGWEGIKTIKINGPDANGSYGPPIRSYHLKIFKNGLIVRDLYPVRIEQVGYMYDLVSEQLFGNTGTGSFILGNDIT